MAGTLLHVASTSFGQQPGAGEPSTGDPVGAAGIVMTEGAAVGAVPARAPGLTLGQIAAFQTAQPQIGDPATFDPTW